MARSTLERLARAQGDAVGFDRSGGYQGTIETTKCSCDTGLDNPAITLCTLIGDLEGTGIQPAVEVLAADGSVRLFAATSSFVDTEDVVVIPTFYGANMEDGALTLAGILRTDALVVQGEARGRIDGTLWGNELTGELRLRYSVRSQIDLNFDGDTELQSLDCEERATLDLQRWSDL